jgi:uncharacterized protein DUF1326
MRSVTRRFLVERGFMLLVPWIIGMSCALAGQPQGGEPDWSFNATIIEACSCPNPCPCNFNSAKPAAHGSHEGHGATAEYFCRFNRAFRINKGHHGSTTLDGPKFWMAGDLGGDFSHDQVDWGVLIFEPSATKDQRDAIRAILGYVYPVKWNSLAVGRDGTIEWKGGHDRAEARVDSGRTAELVLKRAEGMTADPIIIKNLKYGGAPRNDGFILMPDEVEAYRVGENAFEFKGTSGFMITIDMTSKDIKR